MIPKRILRSRVAAVVVVTLWIAALHRLVASRQDVQSRLSGVLSLLGKSGRTPRKSSGLQMQSGRTKPGRRPASNERPGKYGGDISLEDLATGARTGSLGDEATHVQIDSYPGAPQHTYLATGVLVPNPEAQHPIFDLVARSRAAWKQKLDRASTTLAEAVDEYRRRYNRVPPRGFDRWWTWSQAHSVQLPDEYDQIFSDLEPFFALTPSQLRDLRRAASDKDGMYTISCKTSSATADLRRCSYTVQDAGLNEEGRLVAHQRAEAQLELIRQVQDVLEDVEAVFYSHDVPWQFVGHDYKGSLEEAAAVGEYYDPSDDQLDRSYLGWASACAPHKPLRERMVNNSIPDLEGLWDAPKSFVWDHKAVMDPCTNPDLVHLMGFLSSHGKGPGPTFEMFPVMAMCKTMLHSDVLAVSAEAWTEDVGDDPEWEHKPDDRLLWRGKTTGIFFKDSVPWNISQRINLVDHADRDEGSLLITPLKPQNESVGAPERQLWTDLNTQLMDVGFVDDPIQCDPRLCRKLRREYRFAERKDWSQTNRYKYLLDIDGNGWSARFKRQMSSNSVVLKSTIFPEWYSDRIQPWVHYIPVKPDLTDLYDVMTFFQTENDALAKEIAMMGKHWSKTFWRKEDMVAYQFRLLLELARLMAPDRDEASYHARG